MWPGYDALYFKVVHKREKVLRSATTPAQRACAQRYAELADQWLQHRDEQQLSRGPLSKFLSIFTYNKPIKSQ